ncbi:MAG: hypothetical protein RL033_4270 [Pseudomonadota bacterium]
MLRRQPLVLVLTLLPVLACSEPEPPPCSERDYSICGSPLAGLWPSYGEDLSSICNDAGFIETSLGQCADGKRVLSRSWGIGGDQRFYEGETLVGRRAGGDVFFVDVQSPQCICGGASFQGTLAGVHCEVTAAEELCGRAGPAWIENLTLDFGAIEAPAECGCRLAN